MDARARRLGDAACGEACEEVNTRKMDLRQDIAELCVQDGTRPLESQLSCEWLHGDRFGNYNEVLKRRVTWRYDASVRGWKVEE